MFRRRNAVVLLGAMFVGAMIPAASASAVTTPDGPPPVVTSGPATLKMLWFGTVGGALYNGSGASIPMSASGPENAPQGSIFSITRTACTALFGNPATGNLTKTVVRTDSGGNATFQVTLTSTRPASQTDDTQDCEFVDANHDGKADPGDREVFFEDDQAVWTTVPGGSQYTFAISIPANPTDTICDQAQRQNVGLTFTDESNLVCTTGNNPLLPESPYTAALPISAVFLLGGVAFYRRQRRTGELPVSPR